jgi:hypothetical protein
MTQQHDKERYVMPVVVKQIWEAFPPGSGQVIQVETPDGKKEERNRHFPALTSQLENESGLKVANWVGTEWEYDFFDHHLVKLLKK